MNVYYQNTYQTMPYGSSYGVPYSYSAYGSSDAKSQKPDNAVPFRTPSCSLKSMSGPLSHLGTPVGPVAMACISVPSTTPRFLKRRTAAVCLFSATLLPQHPWGWETASLAMTENFHQHNSPTRCLTDVSHMKRERVVVAFLNLVLTTIVWFWLGF